MISTKGKNMSNCCFEATNHCMRARVCVWNDISVACSLQSIDIAFPLHTLEWSAVDQNCAVQRQTTMSFELCSRNRVSILSLTKRKQADKLMRLIWLAKNTHWKMISKHDWILMNVRELQCQTHKHWKFDMDKAQVHWELIWIKKMSN